MTDEQIKQKAEEYADALYDRKYQNELWRENYGAHIAGAHSRDEEIEKIKEGKCSLRRSLHRRISALVKEIDDLEDELKKLRNPWISVEERLPDIGQKVITITNKGKLLLVARTTQPPHKEEGGWRWEHYIGKVTHWMPIPQIKKGE